MKYLKLYKIFESFEEDSGITVELGRSKVGARGIIQNIIVKYNGTPITGEDKEPGLGNMNVVIQSEDAFVGDIKIPTEYQGKGLAKHIYQATADLIGKPIVDSTTKGDWQSVKGGYVWKNRTSFQPKKRKEFINESYFKQVEDLNNIIDPIREDIRDILVDFVGYDITFIPANMFDSSIGFELLIKRKGYYNDGSGPMPGNRSIDPISIDEDILDEFNRLIDFIKSEIGFYYTNSYHTYMNNGHTYTEKDLFSSIDQQGGKKFVISISMFFGNKIEWLPQVRKNI